MIARFYDANDGQVGSDTQMGAVGGLAAKIIRPNEIVALLSVGYVDASVVSAAKSYRLFPTWNNVTCP